MSGFGAIAQAESQQITLSIDGTTIPIYADLLGQAESLVEATITEKFQIDPSLTTLQINVLGERNGQLVSLISARISREDWQSQTNIRPFLQYFSTSSALLGYTDSMPLSSRVAQSPTVVSQRLVPEQDSFTRVEQAFQEGRISMEEYYRLIDELD